MTIDEAIELLTFFADQRVTHLADIEIGAVRLGIEALKRVKAERSGYEAYAADLMPGETGG